PLLYVFELRGVSGRLQSRPDALAATHVFPLYTAIVGAHYGATCCLQCWGKTSLEGHKQLACAVPAMQEKAVRVPRCFDAGIDFQRGNIVWLLQPKGYVLVVGRAGEELPAKATSLALRFSLAPNASRAT